MKQFILFFGLVILGACGSNKDEKSQTASANSTASVEASPVNYPLPTTYSPTWEAGDQKNVITVLNVGKGWMANDFGSFENAFADTVSIYLASGDRWIGPRDSIIGLMKGVRKMYSEIKSDIHSIIPLRHRDTKEDWVCIWVKDITTTIQGKKDSIELQESWRLNKDGKAELVYQYSATIKPQ
jgi:hypothetical protein